MPQYNAHQQVFQISLCSNLVRDDLGTSTKLQQLLTERVPPALAEIDPGWSVVSQPVVWKRWSWNQLTKFGNAWFIAKHDALMFEDGKEYRTYVMGIAGTASQNAVLEQDGDTGNMIPIDSWASSGLATAPTAQKTKPPSPGDPAMISNGFGQAVHRHVNLTPNDKTPNVKDFLKAEFESYPDAKFVFTGHSLGAALCSSIAYVLVKSGTLPAANVLVYPSAGPSPGNMTFLENFKSFFPSPEGNLTGYQHWNTNIINPFDIVPCGYCMDSSYTTLTLYNVADMFGTPTAPISLVQNVVNTLLTRSMGVYFPLTNSTIESSIPKPPTPPANAEEYFKVAMQQHNDAYIEYILGDLSKSVFDTDKDVKSILEPEPEDGASASDEGAN